MPIKIMKRITQSFASLSLFVMALLLIHCGQASDPFDTGGDTVPVTSDDDLSAVCVTDQDCDGDGLYDSCDTDPYDAAEVTIKDGCDDDGDGYVDLAYCTLRDANGDGLVTADERDINCDVCPGEYDPDQTDSDEDGLGDACLGANINISADPPDGGTAGSSAALEGTLSVEITEMDARVFVGKSFDLILSITNNTNKEDFEVQLIFYKQAQLSYTKAAKPEATSGMINLSPSSQTTAVFQAYTVGSENIVLPANAITTAVLDFSIDAEFEADTYYVKVKIIYTDDDGNSQTIAQNTAGDSQVEVKTMKTFGHFETRKR